MTAVRVWHLKCMTENASKEVISSAAPSVCPDDSAHTIDADSIRSVRIYSEEKITAVKEEAVSTGGHFQTKTVKVVAAANTISTINVSWKYPINVLAAYFVSEETHRGDEVELIVGENTTVGTITATVDVGATVIDVDSTHAINNVFVGAHACITDGTNTDDLGEIIDVDEANNQITVDIPSVHSFAPGTPLQMSVKMVKEYEIGPPWEYVVGESKIGASYVPAGVITTIRYDNKSPADTKEMIFKIEYLY